MYDFKETFEEKMTILKESIDVMIKFQLYRKGYIESIKNEPKEIGEAINVVIATALEFMDIMKENKGLKEQLYTMMTEKTAEPFYKGEKENKGKKK